MRRNHIRTQTLDHLSNNAIHIRRIHIQIRIKECNSRLLKQQLKMKIESILLKKKERHVMKE